VNFCGLEIQLKKRLQLAKDKVEASVVERCVLNSLELLLNSTQRPKLA